MICDLCSIQESKEAHKRRIAAERSRKCRAKMTLQQKLTANKKKIEKSSSTFHRIPTTAARKKDTRKAP
jgi:hypothetical protein